MLHISPKNCEYLCSVTRLWWALVAVVCLGIGGYMALFTSPADYQQGNMVRIMYVHVPAAWMSMLTYSVMSLASLGVVIWRNPVYGILLRAAVPVGMVFAAVTLVTGSLWGAPIWGSWWVWDARLTSMLMLFLTYLGLQALLQNHKRPERAEQSAALICLLGSLNVVLVKYSVEWFNTLHQPASVFRLGGPTIHPSMLWPLMLMALGFMALGALIGGLRMEQIFIQRRSHRPRF